MMGRHPADAGDGIVTTAGSAAAAGRAAEPSPAEARELRAANERLDRQLEQSRREAALLREVIGALPVGVGVEDACGRVVLVNPIGARTLGRVAAGSGRSALAADAGLDDGLLRAGVASGLADEESQTFEQTVMAAGDDPAGTVRTLLVTSRPVRIADERMLLTTSLDISDHKRLERDLTHRAYHDPLTGLPNRMLMQRIVDAAIERHASGGGFALAFIDLDNFKRINDYYSHAVGDGLLRAVAERITARIRPTDTLARISGDEFLLLVDPVERVDGLAPLIERIVDALREPFRIEGLDISTSASVGASVFPEHGRTYDDLQRGADSAMYRVKRDMKGRAALYSAAMGEAHGERMAREIRLRAAVDAQRFRAALQPKVDLLDGRVVGFEALARWVDAGGQVRGPDAFIAMASEMGLLDEIAEQVAGDVLGRLPALQHRFGAQTTVSLNVSARQAGDNRFMQRLTERLCRLGCGRSIVLEVTEDALLATQHFQQDILPMLREAGIRVSIDDFGTGYSSLAMLADLTADEVKIDRAFISGIHERPRSQGILKAIESLCATLGIAMVAEGVEQAAELDYLRRHTRIGMAQGYCFDRAAIIGEVLRNPVRYQLEAGGGAAPEADRQSAAASRSAAAADRAPTAAGQPADAADQPAAIVDQSSAD